MSDPTTRPRRPPAGPSFDPAAQPWQTADAELAPVPPALLAPDLLRKALSQQALSQPGPWPQDAPGSTEHRHPGRVGAPVLAAVLIPLVLPVAGVGATRCQRTRPVYGH